MRKIIYIICFFFSTLSFGQKELSMEQIIEISNYIFQLERKDSSFISGMQSVHSTDLDTILDPYEKFKRFVASYDTLLKKYTVLDSMFNDLKKQNTELNNQLATQKPIFIDSTKKDTLIPVHLTNSLTKPEEKKLPERDSTYLKEPIYKIIQFDINSSILNKKFHPELDELVKLLTKNSKYKVHLEGTACGKGNQSLNDLISSQRAMVIKNYLMKHEIKMSRIISSNIVYDDTNIAEDQKYKFRTCHIRLIK